MRIPISFVCSVMLVYMDDMSEKKQMIMTMPMANVKK